MSHDGDLQNFTSVHHGNQRLSLRSRRLEVMGAGKNEARERETCVSPSRAPFLLRLRQELGAHCHLGPYRYGRPPWFQMLIAGGVGGEGGGVRQEK